MCSLFHFLQPGFIDFPGLAFVLVIAATIIDHGVRTPFTWVVPLPGMKGLIQAEWEMVDSM